MVGLKQCTPTPLAISRRSRSHVDKLGRMSCATLVMVISATWPRLGFAGLKSKASSGLRNPRCVEAAPRGF
eukprot:5790818-Alexandrium_andersonii.AAC.1